MKDSVNLSSGEIEAINEIFGTDYSKETEFEEMSFVSPSFMRELQEKRKDQSENSK